MINRILLKIKKIITLENAFNKIGFSNVKFIKNFNFIKIASLTNINRTADQKIVLDILDTINHSQAFTPINILLALDDNSNDKIYYKFMNIKNMIEATNINTKQDYILIAYRCDLVKPQNSSDLRAIELQSQSNQQLKYYLNHPIALIINCYLNNNGTCQYQYTKQLFFTSDEYKYSSGNQNLVSKFNLQVIEDI